MLISVTICDSAYILRNPLTICGFRFQFADSTYSCRLRDNLSLLNSYIIICSQISQIGSGFHSFCCGFRKVACFWSDFEQHSVLAICPWNPKKQRRFKKITMLWIPRQIWFLPVAESAYNSQNAQFCLVSFEQNFLKCD